MQLQAHTTQLNPDDQENVVTIYPAGPEAVLTVLDAGTGSEDGRSQWLWVRLGNGDLILGVFPQGDTYFATEHDHSK